MKNTKFILLLTIFFFVATANAQKSKLEFSQILYGKVLDKDSKEPLSDFEVSLTDITNDNFQTQIIENMSDFEVNLLRKNEYKIEVKKNGYKPQSKMFTTSKEKNKELKFLILLRRDTLVEPNNSTKKMDHVEALKKSKNDNKELLDKQKKTEKQKKKAEKKLKKAEKEVKKHAKAQDNFSDAKKKYDKEFKKYQKLKSKGKLSPEDEVKWLKKLEGLQKKIDKTERKL